MFEAHILFEEVRDCDCTLELFINRIDCMDHLLLDLCWMTYSSEETRDCVRVASRFVTITWPVSWGQVKFLWGNSVGITRYGNLNSDSPVCLSTDYLQRQIGLWSSVFHSNSNRYLSYAHNSMLARPRSPQCRSELCPKKSLIRLIMFRILPGLM